LCPKAFFNYTAPLAFSFRTSSHILIKVSFGVISLAQRNIYLPTGALDGYVRDPFEFLISPSHLTGVYPTRYRYPSNFHFPQLRLVRFFVSPNVGGDSGPSIYRSCVGTYVRTYVHPYHVINETDRIVFAQLTFTHNRLVWKIALYVGNLDAYTYSLMKRMSSYWIDC
jgi:hypothetical protein